MKKYKNRLVYKEENGNIMVFYDNKKIRRADTNELLWLLLQEIRKK